MKKLAQVGGLFVGLWMASSAMASWVVLGHPNAETGPYQSVQLSFIPESVNTVNHTVVVKREQDAIALNHEVRNMAPIDVKVTHSIAHRQYRCHQRQFHTPAAQYLNERDQVVYEYDYRLRSGLLYQLQEVDMNIEAEQTLFKRVC